MSYPVGWDLVNITGTYIGRDGNPCVGSVTLSSPQLVLRSGTIVPAADIVFDLVNGTFSGQIPATDDPNAQPSGWVYTVTENVPGGRQGYQIVAPHTSPGIDLSTVIPVTMPMPPTFGFPYVTLAQLGAGTGAALVGFLQAGTGAVLRTVQQKEQQAIQPEDFGCVGDGVTDDTVNYQKALDAIYAAGGGQLTHSMGKTYLISNTLTMGNGTRINMLGGSLTTTTTFPVASQILTNKNSGGGVNVTTDNYMVIENGSFICKNPADRTTNFVGFIKAGNLIMRNISIINPPYFGIYLAGCRYTLLDHVTITGTGMNAVTAEGGVAIAVADYGGDGSTSFNTIINNPVIYNCQWAAITINGNSSSQNTIINPIITNVRECGIICAFGGMTVIGGMITGVTRKDISGSGMELNGAYMNIVGTNISGVDNCGISTSDCQNLNITGVTTIDVRRDPVTFSSGSHISIVSHTASPGQPSAITISGHMAIDYSSPAYAAVIVDGSAPGSPVAGVAISGGNYTQTAWTSGTAIYIDPNYWNASSSSHRNNNGADDFCPACVASTSGTGPTLTTGVATTLSFSSASPNSVGSGGVAFWVSGTPTEIIIPETGNYIFTAQVSFSAAAGGTRTATIRKNGSTGYPGSATCNVPGTSADLQTVQVSSGIVPCTHGDIITLVATQDSGGSLSLFYGQTATWLSVRRV